MLRKQVFHTLTGDNSSFLKCSKILRMCTCSYGESSSRKSGSGEGQTCATTQDVKNSTSSQNCKEFLENLDENLRWRKKRLEAEFEEYRMRGFSIPQTLSASVWHHLLTVTSSSHGRLNYLTRLAERENPRDLEKHDMGQQADNISEHDISRLLCHPESRLFKNLGYACYRALVFGAPLVMDLGYDMTYLEQEQCFRRLMGCYKQNMIHTCPFHIHFTGYKTSYLENMNQKYGAKNAWCASFHKNQCTDAFNKDDLIYLSPHGHPIKEYDAEKIYVIGAYVNFSTKHDQTVSRARQLGIDHRRLPLVNFGFVSRDLGLNTVMDIMLEVGLCRNWDEAVYKALVTEKDPDIALKDRTGPAEMWRKRYEKNSLLI